MAQDFGYAWRTVKLHVPLAPTFLVREWVNDAWKTLARVRHWTFLKGDLRLTIGAARAIAAVTVTNGSATVTSAGLFVTGDAGRTFRVTSYPAYTILAVPDVNTLTLDTAYGETSQVGVAATIYDGFATLPADFESFRLIADPYTQRRLPYWITEDQLNILDPSRTASDSGPRALIATTTSPVAATLARVRYEYWPRPTAARSYPALYNRQPPRLDDTSTFSGVLAEGGEVLVAGALWHAASWPGTVDQRNPYFNLDLAKTKQAEFYAGVQRLSLRDDDQSPDDLATVHWERWPLADLAYNDQALRSSDATLADFY
jgi:hypothetical protein